MPEMRNLAKLRCTVGTEQTKMCMCSSRLSTGLASRPAGLVFLIRATHQVLTGLDTLGGIWLWSIAV